MLALALHNRLAAMSLAPHCVTLSKLVVDLKRRDGRRLRVLNGLDLTFPRGSFTSIVGPSGGGKSTLLRTICGLVSPTTGTVDLDVMEPGGVFPPVAFNFQQPVLLPWLTVEANALLPFRIRGAGVEFEVRRRLDGLLATVGLTGFRDALPDELSGGMKMRAALVRCFLPQPRLVLMDEPFASLDEVTRTRLGQELLTLWQRLGCTILFVTHSLHEAVTLSDRVVVLSGRPASVVADMPIRLPRPRDTRAASYQAVHHDLTELVHHD